MKSLTKILVDIFIVVVIAAASAIMYFEYKDVLIALWEGREMETIFINDLVLEVTVADEPAELAKGLSGVKSLGELEGKLFIFEENSRHGIWMKDMNFPIDIFWINEDLEIVDIKENVDPQTYPRVFRPDETARFVLETNAYLARTFKVEEGERLILPSTILPLDIRQRLQ